MGLGIGAIVFGLIEGTTYGWWKVKQPFAIGTWTWPFTEISVTPVAFAVGGILIALFVWWELRLQRRGGEPLFDFTLMRFRSFRFGLITVSIVALGEFGLVFVLSIFLQTVLGLTAFQTGLVLLPFALTTLIRRADGRHPVRPDRAEMGGDGRHADRVDRDLRAEPGHRRPPRRWPC